MFDRMSAPKASAKKKVGSVHPELGYREPEDIGPGAYDCESAMDSLKPRSPSPDLKNSRPYKQPIDPSVGPAALSPNKDFVLITNPAWSFPGQYPKEGDPEPSKAAGDYDPINTNKPPGFTFPPEKKESPVRDNRDYDTSKADSLTRAKVPAVRMGGKDVKKRDTSLDDIGPGRYGDEQPKFGDGVPTFAIAKKRDPPKKDNNPAPGQYETAAAEDAIKTKNPSAYISKDRKPDVNSNTAQGNGDPNVGPGAYSGAEKSFGADVKPMTIGKNRPKNIEVTGGPGMYDPDKAIDAMRTKSPS